MPYDEAITLAKITELDKKRRTLRNLESDVAKIIATLQHLLDREEQDKEVDGTPKVDSKGLAVLIKVMPIDEDTLEKLTPARRIVVFDKMIVAADAALAKTA